MVYQWGIFTQELAELYNGKELSPLSIQYKDYSVWQRDLFTQEEMKKQEEYWMHVFKEEVPVLNMPTDYKDRQFKVQKVTLYILKSIVTYMLILRRWRRNMV
ncbi:condensation domain-containing protein [Bacillus cereus]